MRFVIALLMTQHGLPSVFSLWLLYSVVCVSVFISSTCVKSSPIAMTGCQIDEVNELSGTVFVESARLSRLS